MDRAGFQIALCGVNARADAVAEEYRVLAAHLERETERNPWLDPDGTIRHLHANRDRSLRRLDGCGDVSVVRRELPRGLCAEGELVLAPQPRRNAAVLLNLPNEQPGKLRDRGRLFGLRRTSLSRHRAASRGTADSRRSKERARALRRHLPQSRASPECSRRPA